MARRGRNRRSGRVTPKGTRPSNARRPREPGYGDGPGPGDGEDQDLIAGIRQRLDTGEPLDLLAEASTLLTVVDPRIRDPFDPEAGAGAPTKDDLVRSFLGVDLRETSALLAAIAELDDDEVQRARIRRELSRRSHDLPGWIGQLGDTQVYRAVEQVHVLGDGDNVILGTRISGSQELSVVVYIDHNLGTVVKDAFVVPESLDALLDFMREKVDDPDTVWNDLSLADARARISEAVDHGARTWPPFETDTWPVCRPLVEWLARRMPPGGRGYERPDWGDDQLAELATRFFASSHGAGLDDARHRDLLDSILWFGSGYGPGDPLRWSPVAVEILLTDWIPRKIVADADFLALAPELLRAFVRFSHQERGIRASLTDDTVAAVDRWEPAYQGAIRSERLQGPAALLAAAGVLDPDDFADLGPDDFAVPSYREMMLDSLAEAVGGDEALDGLDDTPLADEAFAWDGIPDDIHDRVAEVAALCDGYADHLGDPELRTACRRLLARVAAGDPEVFRRRGRVETAAAAVCWIVGKANDLFSPQWSTHTIKEMAEHFGIAQAQASSRGKTLLRAGGFEPEQGGGMYLGSSDYLVSARRARILVLRDRYRTTEE